EQRDRGAALIVTTHMLGEAELIADRVAIMRRGVIVKAGTLDDLRLESGAGRRFVARLAAAPTDLSRLDSWLDRHAMGHELEGERLSYTLPWDASVRERAEFAAGLQSQLTAQDAPFHQLEEQETSLESVYLSAMEEAIPMQAPPPRAARAASGIAPRRMFASILSQGALLRHVLPFYVSSWWRRGDLSWVLYLNAFVLLLVAATSLFGQLPGPAGQVASRFAGTAALQAGLLLPLFFLSFALLESIKSSIGIWWEKAQGSLEVLLHPDRRPVSHLARGAARRDRQHGLGDGLDGCRVGPPQPVRRGRALGPAACLRLRRSRHLVLGGDGANARLHAFPPRGRRRWRLVVLALAGLGGRGGSPPRPLRLSLSASTGLAPASDHGLRCADHPLRRNVRPRKAD